MTNSQSPYLEALRVLATVPTVGLNDFQLDFLRTNLQRIKRYGPATRFSATQKATIEALVNQVFPPARAAELLGQQRLFFEKEG